MPPLRIFRGRRQQKKQTFPVPAVPNLDAYRQISVRDDAHNGIYLKNELGELEVAPNIDGVRFHFKGENNTVVIEKGSKFANCFIKLMGDSTVIIEKGRWINNLVIDSWGNGNCCYIAKDFSCIGATITMHEEKTVFIDCDCQFSYDISIWTTDGHAILHNGQCINRGDDVYIGKHVWLGHRAELLKGAYIADNSLVGACSLVNKKFVEKNVIISGVPAKIIRRNISWDRRNPVELDHR